MIFNDLILKWQHRGRRLIWDVPKDKSMIKATEAMKHDAMIYANCIRELMEVLRSALPEPSTIRGEYQK